MLRKLIEIFLCARDKTREILKKNEKLIKILEELCEESESPIDDFVVMFVKQQLLITK